MSNISILIGSMLGASEYVADHLAVLLAPDHDVTTDIKPTLDNYQLTQAQTWIICTSTHGAGDFPDNICAFVDQLQQQKPDLSMIEFAVCALGDRNYDTFCKAGITIDRLLESLGASRIAPINLTDVNTGEIPEESAELWLKEWRHQLK